MPMIDYGRRYSVIVTVAALVLLHFSVVSVLGYPVTIGLLLIPAMIALWVRPRLPSWSIVVLLLIVSSSALQALLVPTADRVQYLRSLVLLVIALGTVCLASLSPLKVGAGAGATPYLLVLFMVDVVAWLQFLTGRRGSLAFFNPWRGHQYLYNYNPHLGMVGVRAEAFYLEPSFAALVLVVAGTAAVLAGCRPLYSWLLVAIGLGAVRSAAGLISLGAMVLLSVLLPASTSWNRHRKLDRVLLVGCSLAIAALFAPYLATRISAIHELGSSSNYRLAAPLVLIRSILGTTIIGRPLGSVNAAVASAGLLNGEQAGTSLDNGTYVIVYYFGWVGILAALTVLVSSIRRARASGVVPGRFALVATVTGLSTLFTGAVFTPEYALLVGILILEYRAPGRALSAVVPRRLSGGIARGSSALVRNHYAQ